MPYAIRHTIPSIRILFLFFSSFRVLNNIPLDLFLKVNCIFIRLAKEEPAKAKHYHTICSLYIRYTKILLETANHHLTKWFVANPLRSSDIVLWISQSELGFFFLFVRFDSKECLRTWRKCLQPNRFCQRSRFSSVCFSCFPRNPIFRSSK